MGTFKKFLNEDDELLNQILDMLLELSEDEIDDFGYFLYTEFFEDDPTDDEEDEPFDLNDVIEMIKVLGPDMYEYIIDMLEEDEIEDEIEEAVSRMMKSKNMNRKKRKFMRLSKAALRRTKAIRKRKARKTMSKRKRYYRANKVKIASYQKSRAKAIKKGKHFKKLRKRNG